MRVLVVDDDPIMLDLLAETLQHQDEFEVDLHATAESGLDALRMAKLPFDCILLDIMLPGINGLEMCEVLRRSDQHCATPILMITGLLEIGLISRAFKAGATDFIQKPFDPGELRVRVAMAGLLSESISRAREKSGNLATGLKVRFEDPVDLEIGGICSLLELENELLRCRVECFAMTMFRLDLNGLRGIYRAVQFPAFRKSLQAATTAALDVLRDRNVALSYVGSGRFIGAIMDRRRFDKDALDAAFDAKLAEYWDAGEMGASMVPNGCFTALSTQRFWSAVSASDKIRAYLASEHSTIDLGIVDENDLFERLQQKLPAIAITG